MNKARISTVTQGAPTHVANIGTLAYDEVNDLVYFNGDGAVNWIRANPFPAFIPLDTLLHGNVNQTIGAVQGRQQDSLRRGDFGNYAFHNEGGNVITRANDSDGPYVQYGSTGTSTGFEMGTSRDVHRMEFNTAFTAKVKVTTTADIRFFVGITDRSRVDMVAINDPAGSYVGLQFSTGRGDTNWQFVTKDGVTQQLSDSGLLANTNLFIVRVKLFDGVSLTGQVEVLDATEAQLATVTFDSGVGDNVPAATTNLQFVVAVDRPAGVATPAIRAYSVFGVNRFENAA